jgi:hypothetical protein
VSILTKIWHQIALIFSNNAGAPAAYNGTAQQTVVSDPEEPKIPLGVLSIILGASDLTLEALVTKAEEVAKQLEAAGRTEVTNVSIVRENAQTALYAAQCTANDAYDHAEAKLQKTKKEAYVEAAAAHTQAVAGLDNRREDAQEAIDTAMSIYLALETLPDLQ